MDKLKKVSIVWGIVAILLFAFLTTMGLIYKNKSQKYKDAEEQLVKEVKSYTATDFKFPANGEEVIITLEELKKANIMKELKVENQTCDGYVALTFNNVTEYKAYIRCDKYTTHGYDKNKLN